MVKQSSDPRLTAISPLDGRYRQKVEDASEFFSEYALIRYRVIVELRYYYFFLTTVLHKKVSKKIIDQCIESFDEQAAMKIKEIERTTNHDVKSVEYYVKELLLQHKLPSVEYVHFALTSEDVNAIAYGLMLKDARDHLLIPEVMKVLRVLADMGRTYADTPMLARTHGQPAVPTTMGKECIVFAMRIHTVLKQIRSLPIEAKLAGAVGNFNAHVVSFPERDWITLSDSFISSLGLTPNHFVTQIIPADNQGILFQHIELLNTICIGLSQDVWRYISDGYLTQIAKKDEVGSSTMPQKVNPIDFENAEGNFGLANATLHFLSSKLIVSRLQRDLSDSTVKRSIGTAIATSIVGYRSLLKGFSKISVNTKLLEHELLTHWEIVTEGIQTLLRTTGDVSAYEKVKAFVRGKNITEHDVHMFIESLDVSPKMKERLLAITPLSYTGIAKKIVQKGYEEIIKEYV